MPSVLADFVAYVFVETEEWDGPQKGRVLVNETQLVVAIDEDQKTVISLDTIFDINIGHKPQFVDSMPGTPVTVGFTAENTRATAVVSTDEQTSEKFRAVIFKAILNGTYTMLKHPAKVGGRVLDTEFEASLLALQSGSVSFDTDEGPLQISLDSVIDFSRETRTVDGDERLVLVVSHVDTGEAMTTVAAMDSARKLSLLGRYMRRRYQRVINSLEQLTLSEQETEVLTTLYSVGDSDISLPGVLGLEPKMVKQLLTSLHENGLIESGDHGPVLTARGQIVVNQYLERVNA